MTLIDLEVYKLHFSSLSKPKELTGHRSKVKNPVANTDIYANTNATATFSLIPYPLKLHPLL